MGPRGKETSISAMNLQRFQKVIPGMQNAKFSLRISLRAVVIWGFLNTLREIRFPKRFTANPLTFLEVSHCEGLPHPDPKSSPVPQEELQIFWEPLVFLCFPNDSAHVPCRDSFDRSQSLIVSRPHRNCSLILGRHHRIWCKATFCRNALFYKVFCIIFRKP